MSTLTTRQDLEHPSCAGCDKREFNLIYCPTCNASYCEECAAEHRHACEECGGTGTDPGSLHEPEPCVACDGSKLGDSLTELNGLLALAFYEAQQRMEAKQ